MSMLNDGLYQVSGDKKAAYIKKKGATVLIMEKEGQLANRDKIIPGSLNDVDESAGFRVYPSKYSPNDTIVEAFAAFEQKRKPRWK